MDLDKKKLLVIAPHPDDDVAGCGGLMAKVKALGGEVYLRVITLGDEPQYGGKSDSKTRKKELEDVSKELGLSGYDILFEGEKFHLKLDSLPQKELVDALEKKGNLALNALQPDIVAIPAQGSYNQDHEATFLAAITALRPRPSDLKPFTPSVIAYEGPYLCWGAGASFSPTLFVDISDHIDKKMAALRCYASQLRPRLHPFSEENIKRFCELRGRSIGVEYAEGFVVLREVS